MKNLFSLMIGIALCMALLAGCGSKGAEPATVTQNTEHSEESGECYVTFEDGDYYEYPVAAFGEEFELPESSNQSAEGEFIGWLGMDGIHQPGEMIVAEEFMGFTALRSDPNMGTVVAINSVRGGYMVMSSEDPIGLYSPYEDYDGNNDDFFDHWEDADGNVYQGGDTVSVDKGQVVILNAVYSTDTSEAYRINVFYNTGIEDFDENYYRYIKKGESITLFLMIEPEGCTFEGWYDEPEGGSMVANDIDLFTPVSDMDIYGHWANNNRN